MQRLRIVIFGAVQGVGFRPFVYRLATELALAGWVQNSTQGVVIEAEGGDGPLRDFLARLRTELPPRAFIQSFEHTWLDGAGYSGFEIRNSDTSGTPTALILPDIAPCPDCLAEIFDPSDRRHLYPFTNCTNCGPRYSIIDALPYDRANTSMRGFAMCAACAAEYHDPADRRFHAQPNACPDCGPSLALLDAEGREQHIAHDALLAAAAALRNGSIVAVKGVGGFHLMVDARNEEAIVRLRARKHREEKPLAVMFPSLDAVRQCCDVTPQEEHLLTAPEAPIVLLRARTQVETGNGKRETGKGEGETGNGEGETGSGKERNDRRAEENLSRADASPLPLFPSSHTRIFPSPFPLPPFPADASPLPLFPSSAPTTTGMSAPSRLDKLGVTAVPDEDSAFCVPRSAFCVPRSAFCDPRSAFHAIAPNNPTLGVMLPSSPLHAILLHEMGFPVIATSGNVSDEPICIDENDALVRLRGIADLFLVHNRPIRRHVDDSIARIIAGREMLLRRARGYAPLPVAVPGADTPVVALGAHQKNTVALAKAGNIFVSQHIGDLSTLEARDAFTRVRNDMLALYGLHPQRAVCDRHPDYHSTHAAEAMGTPVTYVQHHAAHVAACKAENDLAGVVLGVAWDGTGLGLDGSMWGGEFLRMDDTGWSRLATLRAFPLPGGDAAAREPRRAALGLLYAALGEAAFETAHVKRVFASDEAAVLRPMLRHSRLTPQTSSAGRLFDAVSSLLHVRQRCAFEGQAAMELEFLAADTDPAAYPFALKENNGVHDPNIGNEAQGHPRWILDWEPMVRAILIDLDAGRDGSAIAAAFHTTLADMIVAIARIAELPRVLLSGGCFQNRLLSELAITRLRSAGFTPYWHQRFPPNDGCIALGQAVVGSAHGG